jgi:hypothetical protein
LKSSKIGAKEAALSGASFLRDRMLKGAAHEIYNPAFSLLFDRYFTMN